MGRLAWLPFGLDRLRGSRYDATFVFPLGKLSLVEYRSSEETSVHSVPVWKIVLVAALVVWGVWQVYPSLVWYSLDKLDRDTFRTDAIRQLEEQITALEQQRLAAESPEQRDELSVEMTRLRKQADEMINDLKAMRAEAVPFGLDLQGGVHVVLKVDMTNLDEEDKPYVVDQVIESLRNRIDNLGVREPLIQRQGIDRILVQIPSITDPADVLTVIGKTAQLEFRFAKEEEGNFFETYEVLQQIDEALPSALLLEKVRTTGAQGEIPWILKEDFPYFQEHLLVKDEEGHYTHQLKEELKALCPYGYTLMFGNTEEVEYQEGKTVARRNIYLVSEKVELTGKYLTDASVQQDMTRAGELYVAFSLDSEGGRIFSRVTGGHVGDYLAIVLDGTVYSAPRIQGKILGSGQITGNFDLSEAKLLAVILRSGALPASVTTEENRTIDPTLGADSVHRGIVAGLCGAAVVVLFMAVYYSVGGLIAIVALALNGLLLAAALAFIPATLTLPGIAGAILIVGMAVDANVLIFERIREEVIGRADRAFALIVDRGFGRAFWTIWDANITTLITALVLFQFGTGPVKGFAVTLSLGIVISMFTAIFVGRMIFDALTGRFAVKRVNLGFLYFFGKANYNFLAVKNVAIAFSVIMIVVGLGYVGIKGRENLGVDLTSGSSIRLSFEVPADEGEIREALSRKGLVGFTVYRFGDAPNEVMVRTKTIDLPEGRTSVGGYIKDLLDEELPGHGTQLRSDDSVGPTVGGELLRKAILALLASAIFIIIYIAIRFEFAYAVAAVVALFHDVLFTLGVFCLTNLIPGQHREINLPIIAALLTIVGYSLNDTIVVFDRIRENRRPGRGTFDKIVNESINQTLSRTIITSLTTLLVVAALFLFGGAGINDFAYTLLIGIVVGTYSSIFIASPTLLWWHGRKQKKAAVVRR